MLKYDTWGDRVDTQYSLYLTSYMKPMLCYHVHFHPNLLFSTGYNRKSVWYWFELKT